MTMFRSILWICVTFNLATGLFDSHHEDKPSRRIGGPGSFNTLSSEYPFAVYIRVTFGMRPMLTGGCSGSIIHPNVVLTAGHCLCRQNFGHGKSVPEFLSLRRSYVLVGANSALDESPHIAEIVDAKVWPEFDYHFIGDIGILRTAQNMVRRAMGGRVVYRGPLDHPEDPRIVTIAGYGENNPLKNTNDNFKLRSGHMQSADLGECKSVISEHWAPENRRYLCLTSYEAQSLHGDSGGPVIHKGRLVGVQKGGRTPKYIDYECSTEGFKRYVVAERVSYYEDWIDNYLALVDSFPEEFEVSDEKISLKTNPSDCNRHSNVNIIHPVREAFVIQPKGFTTALHENGRETVVHPDGSISFSQPDGSTVAASISSETDFYLDGGKIVILPDKSAVIVQPNGREGLVSPHGGTSSLKQKLASKASKKKTAMKIALGDKTIVLPVSVNFVVRHTNKG